jgi:regulatory protein YycI of two-component signal transduction system YycFG
MKIYPHRKNERTLKYLKNYSNYKRVPKNHLDMICFLEEMQNTVTYDEALLLNSLRRMPYCLFLEQMEIFHNINRLYNQQIDFYRNLSNFIESDSI